MSSDAYTATLQGINDATRAANAAGAVGFTSGTIIFKDIEAYSAQSVPVACRNATDSYVNGWDYELKQLGDSSGVYGSGCGSAVADWGTIAWPPTDVWLATANGSATVWGAGCVPDGYWIYDQRYAQYSPGTGHDECYPNTGPVNTCAPGGVRLSIDSDCEDGDVAGRSHGDTDLAGESSGAGGEDPHC